MKVPQSTCSRAAIEQFLADRLSGPELSAFEDHLENCPPCRESLDNLAADSQWWDRARLYLSAAQDGVVPVSNQHHETVNETEQTLFGLKNYLAPTDDPRMLGRLGTLRDRRDHRLRRHGHRAQSLRRAFESYCGH